MTPKDPTVEKMEDLYIRYRSNIYQLALSSTRNHAEAEDIVQEVFLRVVQYWHSFRGDCDVKTWIYRIARNCLVDAARRRMRDQNIRQKMHGDCYFTSLDTVVEVKDILKVLPQNHRQVLDLRIINDVSVKNTAEILGCTEGKVRLDTHRALRLLKQLPLVK